MFSVKGRSNVSDDRLRSFPNKRLSETELVIDNNQSLLYVFVHKPIQRNHTNTRGYIVKGRCLTHVFEYCSHTTLQFNVVYRF